MLHNNKCLRNTSINNQFILDQQCNIYCGIWALIDNAFTANVFRQHNTLV